jgi:hypothetical protein
VCPRDRRVPSDSRPASGSLISVGLVAKKHPNCLEYIVVHEMTHYLERNHGERFTQLMDGFMPDWRSRRDELNDAPLARGELGVTKTDETDIAKPAASSEVEAPPSVTMLGSASGTA